MSDSLWTARADDLLSSTASSAPTPGGGSVAAIVGAFGIGLMQMAIAVTGQGRIPAEGAELEGHASTLRSLQERVVPAADDDVRDFAAVMAAYGLPNTDDTERQARDAAIERASIPATERPLALAGQLVAALTLSRAVEPLVKRSVVSDVLAGRDVVAGAARAAIRTADINLRQLDRLDSPAAPGLRARRDELADAVEEAA